MLVMVVVKAVEAVMVVEAVEKPQVVAGALADILVAEDGLVVTNLAVMLVLALVALEVVEVVEDHNQVLILAEEAAV
jgi:hypothetical protein